MFKIDQEVTLKIDHPDNNEDYYKGDQGTVLYIDKHHRKVLVRFNNYSYTAEYNNHLTLEFYSEEEEEDHNGHLWWCLYEELQATHIDIPDFRPQRTSESYLEYKIARKIYELDFHWREKQHVKAHPVPV